VYGEWLISYPRGRPRNLFERTWSENGGSKYSFSSFLKGEKEKITELTRPNALFLSVGATFNNPQLMTVYKWFTDNLMGIQAGRLRERAPIHNMQDEEKNELIKKLLQYADFGIVDFSIRELPFDIDAMPEDAPEEKVQFYKAIMSAFKQLPVEPKTYEVSVVHSAAEKDLTLSLQDESLGTQQMFFISEPILDALLNGKVLYVDELDSSLHALLVNSLVSLFHDQTINRSDAQLIFNIHSTSLLNMSLFRRDQIWFVEKDQHGASHIYSLLEYRPRKDEALERGYLLGRYGAIPFIGELPKGVFKIV
ncbi:MAG: hypothetical protein A2Z14_13885, partial [Chloroflexi bacterium RBG_16_48_8]